MKDKMKKGDIVYFKSTYTEHTNFAYLIAHKPSSNSRYGKQGGKVMRPLAHSYEYQFCPGDRYLIDDINYSYGIITGNITNLEDGSYHFANQEIWNKLITVDEWREIQLSKIL